jgi:uncharacterized protein (TIGR03000 family)
MTYRNCILQLLASLLFVCVFLPRSGQAQPSVGVGVGVGPRVGPGWYGPGWSRWPGRFANRPPLPPPDWNYPRLAPGPYTTLGYPFYGWPGYYGWPGFRGANGGFWSNGLSLYGPPVPVYGPLPGILGNYDLVHQWRHTPTLGWGVGWFGTYFQPSPRVKPLSVNVWPVVEPVPAAMPLAIGEPVPEGCLILSVKLPQPAAEVFVDGVKTVQTGTDRIYESPPSAAGKEIRYEMTARWLERGVTVEETRVVSGKPGEVVRVDFTSPQVVPTGR